MGFFDLPIVGDLAGGLLGLVGADMNRSAANKRMDKELRAQERFAKNQLQWRTQDAKAAGLHPTLAAGLSSSAFATPSSNQSTSAGDVLAQTGQNISRSMATRLTPKQKQLEDIQLDNAYARNKMLWTQVAQAKKDLKNTPSSPEPNDTRPLPLASDLLTPRGLPKKVPYWQGPQIYDEQRNPYGRYQWERIGPMEWDMGLSQRSSESMESGTFRQRLGEFMQEARRYYMSTGRIPTHMIPPERLPKGYKWHMRKDGTIVAKRNYGKYRHHRGDSRR